MPRSGFVLAIDGPVASGKGTLALRLAKDLNAFYLNTGAMYRSIALLCIRAGIDIEDGKSVESVLADFNIEYVGEQIILNGENVTNRLNEPDTASGASVVGVYKKVREVLVARQQQIADANVKKGMVVIAEGRDTGTVVFPHADFKLYLTARAEVRAKRRMEQYGKSGKSLDEYLNDIRIRDERDMGRVVGPLPKNPAELGYFILDNSDLTEKASIDAIKKELKERKLINDTY
jgi:cytidylate kinase